MISSIFKTIIFLGVLTALLVAVGYALGGPEVASYFFLFSLVINLGSYWFSEQIALKMAYAQPLSQGEAPRVYKDVAEISSAMNIPMPKIYYTNDQQANAFATGRGPKHSSICFTKGIMELLDDDELKGVTAHELAHIKNRDVLIATIAAVLASGISALANAARWFGGPRDDNRNNNPFFTIVTIIIAPIAAFLIQMAISRQREYSADQTGATVTHRPQDLARALEKIEQSVMRSPMRVNPALSSLYIENPLSNMGIMKFFSTHPPTSDRIARLLNLPL